MLILKVSLERNSPKSLENPYLPQKRRKKTVMKGKWFKYQFRTFLITHDKCKKITFNVKFSI